MLFNYWESKMCCGAMAFASDGPRCPYEKKQHRHKERPSRMHMKDIKSSASLSHLREAFPFLIHHRIYSFTNSKAWWHATCAGQNALWRGKIGIYHILLLAERVVTVARSAISSRKSTNKRKGKHQIRIHVLCAPGIFLSWETRKVSGSLECFVKAARFFSFFSLWPFVEYIFFCSLSLFAVMQARRWMSENLYSHRRHRSRGKYTSNNLIQGVNFRQF